MSKKLTGYELSRQWFDFSFDNPEKIRPIHSAIYFFAIEHCNRLGWKEKFGFPTQMAMEAIGVKNWRTYNKGLTDLIDWGFIELIEKSKNQYSSCIICLCKKYNSTVGSLDKALSKHGQDHIQDHGSITVGINKQYNNITKEQITNNVATKVDDELPDSCEFIEDATEIATSLLDAICDWDPTHKYNQKSKPPKSWILSIERAMRIDGRTKEQLQFLIKFIFTQPNKIATFWAGNIQSGKKLRSQFDQIKNQIKNSRENVKHSEIQSTVDSLY